MFISHSDTIVRECEIPSVTPIPAFKTDACVLTCISYSIVRKVAEHTVKERLVAIDDYILRHPVYEFHVFGFQLQCCLPYYAFHRFRQINILKVHVSQCIVYPVEHTDVIEQRHEPLGLHIASVYKLLLGDFVNAGILPYRLKIALYARHRCLQLMGYILCKLPFKHILLLAR